MTAYATQQDLIDRYGADELLQLTDRARTGSIDATVVARALNDASTEIDGYLAGRYQLPLSPVPEAIGRLVCDMARFYLFDDRVPDAVQKRYDNAVAYLKLVANGTVQLDAATNGAPAQTVQQVEFVAAPRVFNRDTLADY